VTTTVKRLLCLAVFAALHVASPAAAAATRPNIICILADDLGWKDVGFHGSDIRTPNLDQLAAAGARLESYYVQPMCTPTRACLMTGRYPFRYGLQTAVILSAHTYGLPTDEWLLPQALKEAGYHTAIVGKWHLGHGDRKYWPRQRGFDHQYGPMIGELDYFTHRQHGVTDWFRDNQRVEEPGYTTTLLGNDAVAWIEAQTAATPFYLYLTFNAPHTPYQAPKEYLDQYPAIADPNRKAYAASITAMDEQIGRVIATLAKKHLRENTLIVFSSDNGGTRDKMFAGEGDMSKVQLPCDNGPYRAGKGTLYEGGTRVCALANWPGHVKPGVVNGVMHAVDLYPTFAALAGASTAKAKPLDGKDVWGTISEGRPSPRTEVVYNIEPFRGAIREGDWKLVWRTPLPAKAELYDLAKDPGEQHDVASANAIKVTEMETRINALAATMAKPMLLTTELRALMERLHMPPALPADDSTASPAAMRH
jgi:arylsulfatase A-like enzyme